MIPLRKLELHSPKSFYPDSRQLFDEKSKPVSARTSFEMFVDYDRQVVLVDGCVIPFSECSHWWEARQASQSEPEEPAKCEKCGQDFPSRQALGGHKRHCKGM